MRGFGLGSVFFGGLIVGLSGGRWGYGRIGDVLDIEIGFGKLGCRVYGFDDIVIIFSWWIRDFEDVDVIW